MITEEIVVDEHDTSSAPFAATSLRVIRQTNGVLRVHGNNGSYLFSLIRSTDGKVYSYRDGFGCDWKAEKWAPKEIKL